MYSINLPKDSSEAKSLVDTLTQANYNHNRGKLGCPYKGMDKVFGKDMAEKLEAKYQKSIK
jgi:hypothetical protein